MKKKLILLWICLSLSRLVAAYSTPNVPIDDPVYRDIDKLVAAGLVHDVIYGQRPWSRREIARILAASMANRKKIPSEIEGDPRWPTIDQILERRAQEYREELIDRGTIQGESRSIIVHPLERVQFDYTLLDSPSRPVPANNGLGGTDAQINPLVAYREGRHYADGNTLGLETTHTAKLSKYFSLYARPRLEMLVPNTETTEVNPIVQQLYGKIAYRNFELEAGRDSLIWGQGEFGGGLLSNNARPLDTIQMKSGSPFFLPGFLKYFGPSQFTFFLGNLGPEREFPYAFLLGGKGSFRPVSFFEFSMGQILTLGGEGSNSIDAGDAFLEFWGIRSRRDDAHNIANRLAVAEGRLTIPFLRNTQIYQEFIIDDVLKKSLTNTLKTRIYYLTGLYVPRLTKSGRTDLRIEYKHLPGIAYRHYPFTSGTTLNQLFLGDPLGPDADVILISTTHDVASHMKLRGQGAFEVHDSDLFQSQGEGRDIFEDARIQDNPAEQRWRLETSVVWSLSTHIEISTGAGYEKIWRINFMPNQNSDNFIGWTTAAFFL